MPPDPDPVPDAVTMREFLVHTIAVLQEATGVAARFVEETSVATGIAIAIRVHGHLSGLTWTFPSELARDAARQMVPDVEPEYELCIAAAAELANMLTGRSLLAFEAHDIVAELSPPEHVTCAAPGTVANLVTQHGVVEVVFHPNPEAVR